MDSRYSIRFIDKGEVKIVKQHGAERYVKKFTTYNHIVVMLFVAFVIILSVKPFWVYWLTLIHIWGYRIWCGEALFLKPTKDEAARFSKIYT